MKTIPLAAALLFVCSLMVSAQTEAGYRIDNFDFANGVRVAQPPASPVRSQKSARSRKLTTSSNLIYTRSHAPLTRLTNMNVGTSLEGFTTGNSAVDSFILESGKRNSVDPVLLYAIMHQESTFKQGAISPKGARGLMQLMPPTARRFGVTNIFNPRQNIEGGARYMRFLLDLFKDVNLALAGYNAGEGAVMKYGYRVPPYRETQEYVRRISRRYSLIRDPLAARSANLMTEGQLAATRQKSSVPLTIYEQSVFAIKTPDGRRQLVSQ
ncbi:MAG: lytic transglycosylase domain-containing protein [Acidobacteriota bacterium]|nr:lytic transglycosylase domain-containing protein [Acidobacteriota bacterium]